MSKLSEKKVMNRYTIVAGILTFACVAVVLQTVRLMTTRKWYWDIVAKSHQNKSIVMDAKRGDILSCDGQLLASTIPEYEIRMDFRPGNGSDKKWDDSLAGMWRDSMTYIVEGLHRIFPQKSEEQFLKELTEGFEKGKRSLRLMPGKIDHVSYSEMKKLPIFRYSQHVGGFIANETKIRRHPFGSLAERTIGSSVSFRFGIEQAFDSLLRGEPGLKHLEKKRFSSVDVIERAPVDGYDLQTTIDLEMQSLTEETLLEQLQHYNAELGVAIVMEVNTGDVKAITNMSLSPVDGQYHERLNDALGYRCEPGSVFKTASFLVALDDGKMDTTYTVDTEGGRVFMYGVPMTDHNYGRSKSYGVINIARTLEVSSNIGVSRVIDHFYGQQPEKYVEGLYRVGIAKDLQLPFEEYQAPYIRKPVEKDGKWRYASPVNLPWMSIGYGTQIPPINTVTFYNAIANNGRMMKPRFVTHALKDGKVVKEFPPEVLSEQIAKPQTIETMQTILEHVVSQGLGKPARAKTFKVAGKTGTAQVSDEKHRYSDPVKCYWLSFCGYFPADAPRYSCIVCVKKMGIPASGGLISGTVFRKIAEGIMAKDIRLAAEKARAADARFVPDVKDGDLQAANYVLSQLGMRATNQNNGDASEWGHIITDSSSITLHHQAITSGKMPDVSGMGARDAVYALESMGLRVQLTGSGVVRSQSIAAGSQVREGMICRLQLGS